jgi:putative hydrolase of the HAD superfamily
MDEFPSRRINPQECACLFDIDNTLYNFVEAKIAACRCAVERIGTGGEMELFRYFLRNVHGFEHHDNIRDFMDDRGVKDSKAFEEACRSYEDVKLATITPYPGVLTTLGKLKRAGVKMAVVTDAESGQAFKRLEKVGIRHYFDSVITPDISGTRKPAHDSFLMALDALDSLPRNAWVVGDSLIREIEPGNQLGMTTVHAAYGDWTDIPYPSIVPDYTLYSFPDLLRFMGLDSGD